MRHTILILLAIIIANSSLLAQDSLAITTLCTAALKQPEKRDSLLEKAKHIAFSEPQKKRNKDIFYYNFSKLLFRTGKLDSAYIIAQQGIRLYKTDTLNYKLAKFYNIIGSFFMMKKEYTKTIPQFRKAIFIFEHHKDFYQVALIKNNIANLFFSLTDYKSAYKYSRESYNTLKAENDTIYFPAICSIYAVSAIKLNELKRGKKLADKGIALSQRYKNVIGILLGNFALGEYYLKKKDYQQAIKYVSLSLELSQKYRQAHYIMLNKVALQNANFAIKEYEKSIQLGEQALIESKKLGNENVTYTIRKHLGYAYFETKQLELAYKNINKAHQIYYETSNAENKKIINNILIKYDTEKTKKQLAEKKLEIAKNKIKLNKRKIWIMILVFTLSLMLLLYWIYNKVQKQRFVQLENEQKNKILIASLKGEEKERKRISNELHDGVASSLTGIKMQLEHYSKGNSKISIENLVGKLENLHEQMRKISHNLMPIAFTKSNFSDTMASFCNENSTDKFTIQFSSNTENKLNLEPNIALVLYRTTQELIHNAQKHAQSKILFVQCLILNNTLTISVEDEGIGFDTKKKTTTQGLASIAKRLESIGAEFLVESQKDKGALAVISLAI